MSDKHVKIKWNCPCGERNRWKHDREETECAPPMSSMECQRCGKNVPVRIASIRYEVTG